MTEVVVGLDLGSSSIKAVAYDSTGRSVGEGRVTTPTLVTTHGVGFPVPRLLTHAREALRAASSGHTVAGIGLTSMGEVGAVVGNRGKLLTTEFPAWHDDRGADHVSRLRQAFPDAHSRSGGHLRAMSSLAKLAWLNEQGGPLKGTFLGVGGLLARGLTGDSWQEASLAATSGAFDPIQKEWLAELWSAAGLADVRLPDVRQVGTGSRARGAWADDDRLAGALVVIAGHDHPVAAVGAGGGVGSVVDSLGTGEPVLAAWDAEAPTVDQVAELVGAGLTVETWPSTGDALLIWEGLCPGLAMATAVGASRKHRDDLEAGTGPVGASPFARDEARLLEQGDTRPLVERGLGPESPLSDWQAGWLDLLATYARDAALGESVVRSATRAAGPLIVTGGGIRSRRWLEAKRAATTSDIHVAASGDTGTRGAAAIVGVSLHWWESASTMPVPGLPPGA